MRKYCKDWTVWCPFDTQDSEFAKQISQNGSQVVASHISNGQDFFNYEPEHWCYIVSNPPLTNKTGIFEEAERMSRNIEQYRKCLHCGETYTEDQAYTIYDTEELRCPFCFDTDYDIVYECEWCGDYYEANELIEYLGICGKCLEDLYKDEYFFKFVENFHLQADSMETIFEGAGFINDNEGGDQDLKILYNALKFLFTQSKLSKETLSDMRQYIFDYYPAEYSEYFVERLQEK